MKTYHITVNGNTYEVQVEEVRGQAAPVVQPVVAPAPVAAPAPATAPAPAKPEVKAAPAPAPAPAHKAPAGAASVTAPMPGTIVDILVKEGQHFKKGDVLLILEAMKMENEIMAAHDGTVKAIFTSKGSAVNSGDALLDLA